MKRSAEATQLELGLAGRVCWSELPEACRAQATELLGQLLRTVAQAEPDGEEAGDER
jgi:hypothetical protein